MTSQEVIERKSPGWSMVLLRLFAGYYFLSVGIPRLVALIEGSAPANSLRDRFTQLASGEQFGWFKTYLARTIERVAEGPVFEWLLAAAPVLLGLALVLGLLTRISTFFGLLMLANVYLVKFHTADAYQLMFLEMQAAVLVVLFLSAAGRRFGIDGLMWRRRMHRKYDAQPGAAPASTVKKTGEPEMIEISQSTPPGKLQPEAGQPKLAAKSGQPKRLLRVEETEGHFSAPTPPRRVQTPAPEKVPETAPDQPPAGPEPIPLAPDEAEQAPAERPTPEGPEDDSGIVVTDMDEPTPPSGK